MRVCIGGTFDPLHRGHRRLIDKAFEIAGTEGLVFIGITTGNMLRCKGVVRGFEERKKEIEKYLHEREMRGHVVFGRLDDRYGPSVDGDFDAIVVSPETRSTAEEINRKRVELGRKPLKIVEIPFVLAEDGIPISSSRIRNGVIDKNGRVLGRKKVG